MTIQEIKAKIRELQDEAERCKANLQCYKAINNAEAIAYTKQTLVIIGKQITILKADLFTLQLMQRKQKAVMLEKDIARAVIFFIKSSGIGEVIAVSGCSSSLYIQVMATDEETKAINNYIDNVTAPAMSLQAYIDFLAIECGLGYSKAEAMANYRQV